MKLYWASCALRIFLFMVVPLSRSWSHRNPASWIWLFTWSPWQPTDYHDNKRSPWWQITRLTNRSPWPQTNHHDNQQITMTTKDHHNNKRNYHYDDKQITTLTQDTMTTSRSSWQPTYHHDNRMMTNRSPRWQVTMTTSKSSWQPTDHHDNNHHDDKLITMLTPWPQAWQQITMTNKWNGKDVGCTHTLSNKHLMKLLCSCAGYHYCLCNITHSY